MTRYYNRSQLPRRFVSVSQNLFRIFRPTLFVLIAVIAGSCEKGVLKLGADILPEGDFVSINSIDTLSVFSYTMYNDSVRTDLPATSYLGQIVDPYFGTTTTGFVTQIRLKPEWDNLPFTVDSMKLYLHLLTVKGGESDAVQYLTISEITDQIYTDSAYYSSTPINPAGFNMTNIELPVLKPDTINDIEITLPGNGVEFGNYITRDPTKLFYNNNIPDFRSFFKGLYFQLNSGSDPLLVSLSLLSDQRSYYNYFILFGHDADGAGKEYFFILDAKNKNASFNIFSHDFSTATSGNKMIHRNTTFRDTLSYLQSLNGVYTKVSIPGLENLKNNAAFDRIAVNKARLVVPVYFNGNEYVPSTVPPQLVLRYKSSGGSRYIVPDWSIEPTYHTFFDGNLDSTANVYNFNIPAFVQAYLKDETNSVKPELEIYQGAGTKNVILKANKSKTPVKFEFTYTKF